MAAEQPDSAGGLEGAVPARVLHIMTDGGATDGAVAADPVAAATTVAAQRPRADDLPLGAALPATLTHWLARCARARRRPRTPR